MGEKCAQAFRNLLVALCVLCSLFLPLYAENENRLGIRLYGSFLYTDIVPNALFFFSDIEKNDSFELRKALRNHDIDTLVLSSRGGSVWEGLSMAGIIHDKGLTTYVPKLGLEGRGDCASACSFMFFAGKTREAEGDVGVHQFYSGSASESAKVEETEEIAQFTVSEIIGFLNEFETPPFVFERMFQQSEMYYFDNREMKQIARTVTPFTQENRSKIEGFIGEFLIELAALQTEEASEAEQKSEPEKSPPPKQQPAKEEADTYTQVQIVKNIQIELNRLNCNAGVADGVIGNKTKSALARYATAAEKFIDEASLTDQILLTELQTSKVKCEEGGNNLICTDQVWGGNLKKLTIIDIENPPKENKKYEIEFCPANGPCQVCSMFASGHEYLYVGSTSEYYLTYSFYRSVGAGICSRENAKVYYYPQTKKFGEVDYASNNQHGRFLNCTLASKTASATTQKTYTTSPKSLASSYKYETCARVSNKRECSTGNLKLRRLKDGEYEFEEEPTSPEAFYGVVKLKGTDIEFQMVDFIESVAVPVSGTGKLRENSGEIVFTFTDQHVLETFKKAGINLANGEIVDLQIRWY